MYKILKSETIKGLLTVDIEGWLNGALIGDVIKDDNENIYTLQSVAMFGGVADTGSQTLVLQPHGVVSEIGKYIKTQ